MAIIIDFSQVVISSLQSSMSSSKINVLTKDLCKHLVLNSLRASVFKFKKEYGQVIIACDSKKYWRKDIFPFYKANRRKSRENSKIDFELLFEVMNEVKPEIKQHFPYKLLEIEKAEADDIIGTLVPRLCQSESVVIISSDGDFKQLQQYPRIKQYNPVLGIFIKSENPIVELKEKILTGDTGDGIPSILSNDNVFVIKERQKPLTKKIKEPLLSQNFDNPNIQYYENIQRNKRLIDLSMIPENIKTAIISEYEIQQPGNKQTLMKYFIEQKMINLLSCIDEF